MSAFDFDVTELFDKESDWGKKFHFDPPTDEMIRRAEEKLGYQFPPSYVELLKTWNGGTIADEYEESWLSTIYGIAPEQGGYGSLENMFENWRDEWEYPDIGIPFGETQSAGHDMYYMDFRTVSEDGEPIIIRIDNEFGNEEHYVAKNLAEFLGMIYRKEEIDEKPMTKEEKPLTKEERPMKAAVRYYTKTGNTKRLAEAVANAIGVEALPISTPITEAVDVLFLGNSYYAFTIDPEVRDFIKSLNKDLVGKIVNFGSAAMLNSTYKKVKAEADKVGIKMDEREFHCKGEFKGIHKGKPDETDMKAVAEFARKIMC